MFSKSEVYNKIIDVVRFVRESLFYDKMKGENKEDPIIEDPMILIESRKIMVNTLPHFSYITLKSPQVNVFLSCCRNPTPEKVAEVWKENREALNKFTELALTSVFGKITTQDNQPLTDAKITVEGLKSSPFISKVGFYHKFLTPGKYSISVKSESLGQILSNVSLEAGKSVHKDFILENKKETSSMKYNGLLSRLNSIAKQYPDITKLYDIGSSVQGQKLLVIELSDNPGLHESVEPEAHAAIKGFVYDSILNKGIPGVNIKVDGRDYNTSTSEFGDFWRILVPGSYNLIATADGYETKVINVELNNSKHPTVVNLALEKTGSSSYKMRLTSVVFVALTSSCIFVFLLLVFITVRIYQTKAKNEKGGFKPLRDHLDHNYLQDVRPTKNNLFVEDSEISDLDEEEEEIIFTDDDEFKTGRVKS